MLDTIGYFVRWTCVTTILFLEVGLTRHPTTRYYYNTTHDSILWRFLTFCDMLNIAITYIVIYDLFSTASYVLKDKLWQYRFLIVKWSQLTLFLSYFYFLFLPQNEIIKHTVRKATQQSVWYQSAIKWAQIANYMQLH